MGNKVCVRVTPMKTIPTLTRTSIHNERREGDRTGSHIDIRYSGQNEFLYGSSICDVWKEIVKDVTGKTYTDEEWEKEKPQKEDLYYRDGKKVRKDAALAAEIEIHYPGKMKDDPADTESRYPHQIPADMDEFRKWKELTLKFITDRFGKDNVKQAVLHMDELTPHIHAIFVPKYQDKDDVTRLSYHKYVDGKKACAMLQTEYASRMKELGYERGVAYSGSEHTAVRRMRKIITDGLSEHLPEKSKDQSLDEYMEEVNEHYQNAVAKSRYLAESNRQLKNVQNTVARRNKKIEELEQTIDSLNTVQDNLEAEIAELKKKLEKSEYERIGCMIHPDQDMIRNIYLPLKGTLTQNGRDYMREHFGLEERTEEPEENIQEDILHTD